MKKRLFSSLVTSVAWAGISLGQNLPSAFPGPAASVPPDAATLLAPVLDNQPAPAPAPAPLAPALPPVQLAPAPRPAPLAPALPPTPMAPAAALPSAAATCGSGCFPTCCVDPCGDRFYVGADYLLWWVKNGPMPLELITTAPFTGGLDGAIGQPGTTSLFGPTNFHYGAISGMRYTTGYWFDPLVGIEASGFALEQRTASFSASSNGNQVIAMPVTNAQTGQQERFTIASPNLRSGNISVDSSTQLYGAELNGLVNLFRANDNSFKLTGLYGFRWVELDESAVITGNSTALTNHMGDDNVIFNGQELVNSSNRVIDSFGTHNSFFGAQLGARAEWNLGKWFAIASVKVGLGDSHEVITNSGSTSALIGPGNGALSGTTGTYPYGRLVGPSNSGTFSHDNFAVVPDTELKIGYQFTRHLKGYVGYNFLYWSNVVRPGDQISQSVDFRGTSTGDSPGHNFTNGFTNTIAPGVPFHTSDFWAQGVNFGLIFSY